MYSSSDVVPELPKQGFQFSPELDAALLNDLYGGQAEYAFDMFSAFFEKIDQEYPLLQQHFKNGDFLSVSKLAHKIKPAFAMVGLPQLEKVFQTIEDSFREKNLRIENLEQILVSADISMRDSLPLVEAEWRKLKNACQLVD